jgi:riboflavin transporter FmnP
MSNNKEDIAGKSVSANKGAVVKNTIRDEKLFSVHKLTMIAMFAVIAYLLMLIRFPLPFMPPFMDFDLAAVPELIGTFLLGPLEGVLIIVVKILIKTVTTGTSSAFTGEVINVLLSSALVLPAWFIYNRKRDKKHALIGMVVGVIVATAVACLANIYIIIPLYARLFGFDMDAVIAMTHAVNKYVNSVPRLVLLGIVPFNIIKNGVAIFIVLVVYKRIVKVMERMIKRH